MTMQAAEQARLSLDRLAAERMAELHQDEALREGIKEAHEEVKRGERGVLWSELKRNRR